jgi:hypothetical protein
MSRRNWILISVSLLVSIYVLSQPEARGHLYRFFRVALDRISISIAPDTTDSETTTRRIEGDFGLLNGDSSNSSPQTYVIERTKRNLDGSPEGIAPRISDSPYYDILPGLGGEQDPNYGEPAQYTLENEDELSDEIWDRLMAEFPQLDEILLSELYHEEQEWLDSQELVPEEIINEDESLIRQELEEEFSDMVLEVFEDDLREETLSIFPGGD